MMDAKHPNWMSNVLKAAAIYNVLFALMTLVAPFWIFDLTKATRPNLPELWQCIGMIVGVYGIGYWIAAYDPYRHWPVVLVGWLGKTFGPLGFAKALWEGVFPIQFGWIIVFNDLIWWWPFALILQRALQNLTQPEWGEISENHQKTFSGFSERSKQAPILVVFLRHSGCTFCREMISELRQSAEELKKLEIKTIVVQMGTSDLGLPKDWEVISDPGRALYRLAGLERGEWAQLFSFKVLARGFVAGVLKGHGVGPLDGDGFMMSGALLWKNGKLSFTWKPKEVSERLPIAQILTH